MTSYLLLHGAASTGWIWYRVAAGLRAHGHVAVAPDLPCADPTATLADYVGVAVTAADERFGEEPVVVVAQSLAGLVAPVVAQVRPVTRIVLVAAMIPRPGESSYDWAVATGHREAQVAALIDRGLPTDDLYDPELVFVHDLDPELKAESARHLVDQQLGPMEEPVPITAWPDVPTRVIAAVDDRFFTLDHMRQQSQERLGIEPDTIPGGHLALLSQASALVERLLAYERDGEALRPALGEDVPMAMQTVADERLRRMPFASIYPHYVTKVERKGRTVAELHEVIAWLTGYEEDALTAVLADGVDLETFFDQAPAFNPASSQITGVICGLRVEEIEDPLMQKIRYLDKLVDELAKGKAMEKIQRSA